MCSLSRLGLLKTIAYYHTNNLNHAPSSIVVVRNILNLFLNSRLFKRDADNAKDFPYVNFEYIIRGETFLS